MEVWQNDVRWTIFNNAIKIHQVTVENLSIQECEVLWDCLWTFIKFSKESEWIVQIFQIIQNTDNSPV